MDPSSDPGRDEYGLPPVDIEIPDDARDLDRDVQAYQRELRVRRRRARLHRLTGPLVRRGMVVPLVAVCLALTLLSGTLLTVVAGRQHASPPAALPSSVLPASTSPDVAAAAQLPDAQVTLGGKPVSLRKLVPAVLAWVPEPCTCLTALKGLARQAARANVRMYLVGTARAALALPRLAQQVGQRNNLVNDTTGAIGRAYSPVGLTAILAKSDGTVRLIRRLPVADPKVAAAVSALASPSPVAGGQGTPSASPSQPAPRAP